MADPATDIEQAVLHAILTASLTSLDAGTVFAREKPERAKGDPDRMCVICVGDEANPSRTNMTVKMEYPVLVVVSTRAGLQARQVDPWIRATRYALRNLLWRPFLLGVNGIVRNCEYDSNPKFGSTGYDQNFGVSGQLFTYRTEEPAPG